MRARRVRSLAGRCRRSRRLHHLAIPRHAAQAADAHNFRCGTVLAWDSSTMRRTLALIVVLLGLLGLLVVLPFAWASTYEAWTDGFYDADLSSDFLALLSLQAVINGVTLTEGLCIEIVAVVLLAD